MGCEVCSPDSTSSELSSVSLIKRRDPEVIYFIETTGINGYVTPGT